MGDLKKDMTKNNKRNKSNDNIKSLNESEREKLIRLREEVEYLRPQQIYRKKLEALIQKKK